VNSVCVQGVCQLLLTMVGQQAMDSSSLFCHGSSASLATCFMSAATAERVSVYIHCSVRNTLIACTMDMCRLCTCSSCRFVVHMHMPPSCLLLGCVCCLTQGFETLRRETSPHTQEHACNMVLSVPAQAWLRGCAAQALPGFLALCCLAWLCFALLCFADRVLHPWMQL
jgi:hypothetical protein